MVVFLVKPVSGCVYLVSVYEYIEIHYMFTSKFVFNLCVLQYASQTYIKNNINGITDFQNMPEYINIYELAFFVFERDVFIN